MRRTVLILLGFTALALAVAAPASALHCFVVKKPVGAGSVGTATFELTTHTLTPAQPLIRTPSGELTGGAFLTVTLLRNGIPLVTADLYFHGDLPDGAHASGPGTPEECDGVGIDDILECVAASL
jgi:hypothetical protein